MFRRHLIKFADNIIDTGTLPSSCEAQIGDITYRPVHERQPWSRAINQSGIGPCTILIHNSIHLIKSRLSR